MKNLERVAEAMGYPVLEGDNIIVLEPSYVRPVLAALDGNPTGEASPCLKADNPGGLALVFPTDTEGLRRLARQCSALADYVACPSEKNLAAIREAAK